MQVFLEVSNVHMAKKEVKIKGHAEAMTCFIRYLEICEYLDMGAGAYRPLNRPLYCMIT